MTEGNGYTVKELITAFVLPELREIKTRLDTKVDRAEFDKLAERMESSEKAQLKEDDVVRILTDRSLATQNAGMSRAQTRFGFVMAFCAAVMMFFAAHSAGVFF